MTYSNQNIFGYQATQHFPYYQEKAIYQREKQVTEYLDSIADSRNNNQSQHDTLVALETMIYNLREVYIFQDVNQNKFYNDNKYLEFVNRQLTAFKDRVLVNYQHYLNFAPSFAPQYLEQNITILHEISHGQYSPIRQLNLEHQPIYSRNYFGQTQATFFSTQQQQNLEILMSFRPRIWTPAPPPVSLFSIASHDANHDPYNSHLPSLTESQRSSQDYSGEDRSSEQFFKAQEDKGQEIFGGGDLGDNEKGGYGDDQGRKSPVLAPAQVSVSAPAQSPVQVPAPVLASAPIPAPAPVSSDQGGNAGGDNLDEFEHVLDDILRDNFFQEVGSSGARSHLSPPLNQSTYGNHAQSINESSNPSPSQLPQQPRDPVSDGVDLSRQFARSRVLLRETGSSYLKEVRGSDGDNSLPKPTNNFADQYTSDHTADPRGQSISEERRQSTSPASTKGGENFGKSLNVEADSQVTNLAESDDKLRSSESLGGDSSTAAGTKRRTKQVSWGPDVEIQNGSGAGDYGLGGYSSAPGERQVWRQGQPTLIPSRTGSDLVVVTGSGSQGTYAEGESFGNVGSGYKRYGVTVLSQDTSADLDISQDASDISQLRPAVNGLRAELVFAEPNSQAGSKGTHRLRSEWPTMTSSQTGLQRMDVASGLKDQGSLAKARVTAELGSSNPISISARPEAASFNESNLGRSPEGVSDEGSSVDGRPIPFDRARGKFLVKQDSSKSTPLNPPGARKPYSV